MLRSAKSCLSQVSLLRPACRLAPRCHSTAAATISQDLYNPTEEHAALRIMLREFVEREVDPQALEFNRSEQFNLPLFRKLGDLGLLGITVEPEYGGSGMDAVAAVIAHGEEKHPVPAADYLAPCPNRS
jgi:alkylation response protein AidB-like acyl-CoA dehydrogenase